MTRPSPRCDWLALWILFSAWCVVSGWILSAFGQLDRAGYAVSLVLFLAALAFKRCSWQVLSTRPLFLARRSTYRSLLPKLWLVLVFMVLAGGLLYHPDNYDFLSYRFPRVLHWTWQHHWYWIDTPNTRQDFSAVGMEWLMAPLLVFFRTDRLFFLLNFISFLLMPGLVFAVFRRLGIAGRVAWWWMWFLPTGYCFLLQAASMGNDAFAGVYLLAALYYAFKADRDSPQALVLSLLSIALLTGAKASDAPLVLPWLAVVWLRRQSILASVRPVLLAGALVAAAVCSALPIFIANYYYTGAVTGDPHNIERMQMRRPLIGIAGNTLELIADNTVPPIWPHPIGWRLPAGMEAALKVDFPRFELLSTPLQFEEDAGAGLGMTVFILLCLFYGLQKRFAPRNRSLRFPAALMAAAIVFAALTFMAELGGEGDSRLFAPYYIGGVIAVLLLLPLEGRVIYRQRWRGVGYAAVGLAFLLVLLNPSRPLLPLRLIVSHLPAGRVSASAVGQLEDNYELRQVRRDGLGSLRRGIPPGEKIVGNLMGVDDPDVSLWLPFGSREVVDVVPSTDLAARHIHYVVVSAATLESTYHLTVPALLKKWSMNVVQTEQLKFKTKRPEETWYLLRSS
jgi:hypothetical protein